jgi:hypothetical protein
MWKKGRGEHRNLVNDIQGWEGMQKHMAKMAVEDL